AVSLLLALASMAASGRAARLCAWLALPALGIGMAASGHAATAMPQWLARPAVVLHVLAIAAWAGSLWPLRQMLRRPDRLAMPGLNWFSRRIPFVALVLVATGVTLALLQFDRVQSLWLTAYGQVFAAK